MIKSAVLSLLVHVVRPVRDWMCTRFGKHPVRVFSFHRVTDILEDGMTVSRERFKEQLVYIARYHDVVTLERALDLLRAGTRLRRSVAVLTFDDGYRSVFEHAFPIMQEVGFPGSVFVSTDLVDTDRRFAHDSDSPERSQLAVMSWNELQQLRDAGWSVGAHSASHARLVDCTESQVRHELEAPLQALEQKLGLKTPPMAYPFGRASDISPAVLDRIRRLGYAACFSNLGGDNHPGADVFNLKRIDIGTNMPKLGCQVRIHGLLPTSWNSDNGHRGLARLRLLLGSKPG